MSPHLRIGLLYASGELSQSIREQRLGTRLAIEHTRQLWGPSDGIELVEREVTADSPSVEEAAADLVRTQGCAVLQGAFSVPLSIRTAQWAEEHQVLYVTANNNPLLRDGRRRVFHIGVPSEVTGSAVAKYLGEERRCQKVGILYTDQEFQRHAAACTVEALGTREVATRQDSVPDRPFSDFELLERMRAWQADAICILGSDLERLVELVKTAQKLGVLPPMLHARGLLCREFADLAGEAGEGHEFTDLYLRDARASVEEWALHRRLAEVDATLVATASHGFGWDGLRLLAQAWRAAGPDADAQVEFLEGLRAYEGATGTLSFSETDHNGRWQHDPTTITRLVGGRYIVVSTLGR